MKFRYILVSIALLYSSFNFMNAWFGKSGKLAEEELAKYQKLLEANIASLEAQARKESRKIERLRANTEQLRIEAYEIGLLSENDLLIQDASRPQVSLRYSPGTLVMKPQVETPETRYFWGFSVLIGMAAFVLQIWFDNVLKMPRARSSKSKRRKNRDQGIRIQTASLE